MIGRSKNAEYNNEPGIPPILCTSSITYFPLGLRSAINGMRSDTDWKSSIVRLMPTECAIAMRCNTAFVEPPRIIVNTCRAIKLLSESGKKVNNWIGHGPLHSQKQLLS